MASHRYSVSGDIKWCSICGLLIPDCIVSATHPLYGTIDHVIPLAAGGNNVLSNRRPAHRWCNERKADRIDPFPVQVVLFMQSHIVRLLRHAGSNRYASDMQVQEARRRIGIDHPVREFRRKYSEANSWDFHQWGTDGGNCLDLLDISA